MEKVRSFNISKLRVWEAYKCVKANRGGAGIDNQSIADFEEDVANNLYKIWNRMSYGSYFPPPVKRVEIPKGDGRMRPLGIPTVADRVAQMVVKQYLEPLLEPYFHTDSYGYRPNKSALDAVGKTRERCWRYSWVLDLDVKGSLEDLARECNSIIRGWINYYGRFNPSAMLGILDHINWRLVRWATCKYKKLRGRQRKAVKWLREIARRQPNIFVHWGVLYKNG